MVASLGRSVARFHFEELMGDAERETSGSRVGGQGSGPPSLQFYYGLGAALTHPSYHYAFQALHTPAFRSATRLAPRDIKVTIKLTVKGGSFEADSLIGTADIFPFHPLFLRQYAVTFPSYCPDSVLSRNVEGNNFYRDRGISLLALGY